jgi:L-alanine-DL-glutamate epimerase-like enolase superfamily enzyme
MVIRVDANQGYSMNDLRTFFVRTSELDIEFIEQPVTVAKTKSLKTLTPGQRKRIALDESLRTPEDAAHWAQPVHPAGIYNIKLMKCGGVTPALEIAAIAERAGIDLMWGCMDESCVGIAAALHAALASPSTRYLDLDGSLDLDRDFAAGGFEIEDGVMRTLDLPGLGVRFV